ncbi:MAG: isopentenyl phosphate kinase [Elusimicrobiota bacterium]
MGKINVFVKLGGSFITDKKAADSLKVQRVVSAARMIRKALDDSPGAGEELSLVLGHGAGSYGHILAKEYGAVSGVHPKAGWEGFHKIRDSMADMNLRFVRGCHKGGLFPVTVQPSAVALAKKGAVARMDLKNITEFMRLGQIPLIHGDIVPDSEQGFTIASTEALLAALVEHIHFDRIVMVSDTDGVLDAGGGTIERIDRRNIESVGSFLGGSGSPDVTGGMRGKVEGLFSLVSSGKAGEARILRCVEEPERLCRAILGQGGGGTLIAGT